MIPGTRNRKLRLGTKLFEPPGATWLLLHVPCAMSKVLAYITIFLVVAARGSRDAAESRQT